MLLLGVCDFVSFGLFLLFQNKGEAVAPPVWMCFPSLGNCLGNLNGKFFHFGKFPVNFCMQFTDN